MAYSSILVTGSEGFIGSHLKRRLSELGLPCRTFARKKGKGVDFAGDLLDYASLSSACKDADLVFHLAGSSAPFPKSEEISAAFQSNVLGTFNLLKAAHAQGVKRVVFASSAMVYGKQHSPIAENARLAPVSHYGLGKMLAEDGCRHYSENGMEVVIARLFNAFGKGQEGRVIPDLIGKLKGGKEVEIKGNAADMRDFLEVTQAVEGLLLLSRKGRPGEAYNLASGKGTRILELAKMLQLAFKARNKSFQKHLRYEYDERTAFGVYADIGKIRKLGFAPKPINVGQLAELV